MNQNLVDLATRGKSYTLSKNNNKSDTNLQRKENKNMNNLTKYTSEINFLNNKLLLELGHFAYDLLLARNLPSEP
jgi:hypothetical protein